MVSIGQIVEITEESAKQAAGENRELASQQNFQTGNKSNNQITNNSSTISKFKIRVPFIHGKADQAGAVPDSQLPDATFCSLPGGESTKLNNGDLVYVSIVDFDYSKLVIIGFVSADQATQSKSGASLTRVQKLEMAENGSASFGNQITISDGKDTINWENLASLSGFTNRLQDYTWPTKNGGTGVSITPDMKELEKAQKQVRDNFGIFSTKIISSEEFDKIQKNNKYEKNTIYYIFDEEEKASVRSVQTTSQSQTIPQDFGNYAINFLWDTVSKYSKRINNPTYGTYKGYGLPSDSKQWKSKVDFGNKLKQVLTQFGYSVTEMTGNRSIVDPQSIINNYIKSYICTATGKDHSKKIVIGAHYDSVLTDGIEDNGTGVSVLIELAKRFKEITPNFDVDFCFWDGEEFLSQAGSFSYVSRLSDADKRNILLYINLDSIGSGDKLFAYGGKYESGTLTKAWGYNFAKSIASENSIELNEIPDIIYSQTYPAVDTPPFDPPTRLVASDQIFFQRENIPYVYFEANAWVKSNGQTGNTYKPYMYNSTSSDIKSTSYMVPDAYGNPRRKEYTTDNGQLIHAQKYDSFEFLHANNKFNKKLLQHLPEVSKIVTYMLTSITLDTPNQFS